MMHRLARSGRRLPTLMLCLCLSGCSLDVPDGGEPFVSESIVGLWNGDWSVDGLPQEGDARLEVMVAGEAVDFALFMAGGALSNEGEQPLEMLLSGTDDEEVVTLTGTAEKLGHLVLEIDKEGSIKGEATPDTIPAVEIGGYVSADEVYLQFLILSLFTGQALLERAEE
jgi:hypothetical protein